jgi:hypothetical protein
VKISTLFGVIWGLEPGPDLTPDVGVPDPILDPYPGGRGYQDVGSWAPVDPTQTHPGHDMSVRDGVW